MRRSSPLRRRTGLRKVSTRPGRKTELLLDRAWRLAVFERDSHRCQMIGVEKHTCRGPLDPHHIKSKAAFPELRHVLGNGITLCRAAHVWAHNNPAGFDRVFGYAPAHLPPDVRNSGG